MFFGDRPVNDFASARPADVAVRAVLPRASRQSASMRPRVRSTWFVSAALDEEAFHRIEAGCPLLPRRPRKPLGRRCYGGDHDGPRDAPRRVHDPEKVFYGRLPGYRLSENGQAQAQAVADTLADRDIVFVVAHRCSGRRRPRSRSRLPRHRRGDRPRPDRVGDLLSGQTYFARRRRVARDPHVWWQLRNPFTPSCGERL